MPFKLNANNPWVQSLGLHLALLGALGLTLILGPSLSNRVQTLDIQIIERPSLKTQVPTSAPMAEKEKPKSTRRVYGMSRKSLVQSDQSAPAPIVKKGNTLSTSPDDKTLNEDDPDSLPSPTDEYLVTAMPTLVEEYRIPYPLEAKAKSIQGAVVMELLIDSQGNVREAKLIEGPGGGLNEAALEAVRKFRFNPARIETQAVTVRIRYAYRFVLER